MKVSELQALGKEYKSSQDEDVLTELYDYLDNHTVYFNRYYENSDGTGSKTATFNEKGRFIKFATSPNYPSPDLLQVETSTIGTVYVQLSDLIET